MKLFLFILLLVASGCDDSEPGGARNSDEIKAFSKETRATCKRSGEGVELAHGNRPLKTEVFVCADGTTRILPRKF